MKNLMRFFLVMLAAVIISACGSRSPRNSGSSDNRTTIEVSDDTGTDAETPPVEHRRGDKDVEWIAEPSSPGSVEIREHAPSSRAEERDISIAEVAVYDHMDTEEVFLSVEPASRERRSLSASASRSSPGGTGPHDGGIQSRPGTITAGEWSDLDNWSFWRKVSAREEFRHFPGYWEFYCDNRVSVRIETPDRRPVVNSSVKLKRGRTVLYTARTDNYGKAELWIGLTQQDRGAGYSGLSLEVDGRTVPEAVKPFSEGVNRITMTGKRVQNRVEVAFVVDATGSMGDELEYLKTELVDVIGKVKEGNPNMQIRTSAVFYRDVGDEYITKVADFENDVRATSDFIRAQYAAGGGDYPEAVHTALEKATGELSWSDDARTRIMFLVLDAPPHHRTDVITSLHGSIAKAAAMGIKIIPVVASGIDKETEFLMRFFALSTNGTYVFITDHSGVGNPHLEPSVGEYQVEYLNDMMVRLIRKFSE